MRRRLFEYHFQAGQFRKRNVKIALDCLINLKTSFHAKKVILSICDNVFKGSPERQALLVPVSPALKPVSRDHWDLLTARFFLFFHSAKNNDSDLGEAIASLKSESRGVLGPETGHLSISKARLCSSIIQIHSRLHQDSQSKFIKLAFLRLDELLQHLALFSSQCHLRLVSRILQTLLHSFSLKKVNQQKHFFKIYRRVWLKMAILRRLQRRPQMFRLFRYYSTVKGVLEGIFVRQMMSFDRATVAGILTSLSKDFIRHFGQSIHEFFGSLDEFVQVLLASPIRDILDTLLPLEREESKAFLVDIFRALLDSQSVSFRGLCNQVLFEQFHQRYFLGNIIGKFAQLKSSSSHVISHSILADFYLRLLEVVFHLNLHQKNDLNGFFSSLLQNLSVLSLGTGQASFVGLLVKYSSSHPQLLVTFLDSTIRFLKSMNDPHLNFDSQIHLLLDLLNQ